MNRTISGMDPRILNARIHFNDQPITAPDKMSVLAECVEQLISGIGSTQPVPDIHQEKKGNYNDGNTG